VLIQCGVIIEAIGILCQVNAQIQRNLYGQVRLIHQHGARKPIRYQAVFTLGGKNPPHEWRRLYDCIPQIPPKPLIEKHLSIKVRSIWQAAVAQLRLQYQQAKVLEIPAADEELGAGI